MTLQRCISETLVPIVTMKVHVFLHVLAHLLTDDVPLAPQSLPFTLTLSLGPGVPILEHQVQFSGFEPVVKVTLNWAVSHE